jgi:hypothetical protein
MVRVQGTREQAFNQKMVRAALRNERINALNQPVSITNAAVQAAHDKYVGMGRYRKRRRSVSPYRRHRRGRGLYEGQGPYQGMGKFNFWKSIYDPLASRLKGISRSPIYKALENRAVGAIEGGEGQGLYSGSGSYTNNLISGQADDSFMGTNSVPEMSGYGDETGAFVIRHREYITDVFAPGIAGGSTQIPFSIQKFPLNPGLSSTFPFLSQLAVNYEEYELLQCIWHFRSLVTDIGSSTTGQCGTIIMATNYNASSEPFTDKQQMVEYAHAHSCKITEHMSHGVECDPAKLSHNAALYTRSNPVLIGQDLKTYDHALFQIAVSNCPAAYNGYPIGELWCEYSVKVVKPKLFVTRGLEIDQDLFISTDSSNSTFQCPFGSAATTLGNYIVNSSYCYTGQQNNIGVALVSQSTGFQLIFPATFTGAVSVSLKCRSINNTVLQYSYGNTVVTPAGNVVKLSDMPTSADGISDKIAAVLREISEKKS